MKCSYCNKNQTCYNDARGELVCTSCGAVLEQGAIVEQLIFTADGTPTGVILTEDGGSRSYPKFYMRRDSNEIALAKGWSNLERLAAQLTISAPLVEASKRLYHLAFQRRFTAGRNNYFVVCACLYAICRKEKAPHLLIDFSDVLQTPVRTLAQIFVRFTRALSLHVPCIDPSFFMERFAIELNFADKSQLVAQTGTRLVQCFTRNWLVTGRRPIGLCGVALLIAAAYHKIPINSKNANKILRISYSTLEKRLSEFKKTPVASLSVSEFGKTDLTKLKNESLPPCVKQRLKPIADLPSNILHNKLLNEFNKPQCLTNSCYSSDYENQCNKSLTYASDFNKNDFLSFSDTMITSTNNSSSNENSRNNSNNSSPRDLKRDDFYLDHFSYITTQQNFLSNNFCENPDHTEPREHNDIKKFEPRGLANQSSTLVGAIDITNIASIDQICTKFSSYSVASSMAHGVVNKVHDAVEKQKNLDKTNELNSALYNIASTKNSILTRLSDIIPHHLKNTLTFNQVINTVTSSQANTIATSDSHRPHQPAYYGNYDDQFSNNELAKILPNYSNYDPMYKPDMSCLVEYNGGSNNNNDSGKICLSTDSSCLNDDLFNKLDQEYDLILSEISDTEVEKMLFTEQEKLNKAKLWDQLTKDVMPLVKERQLQKKKKEELKGSKPYNRRKKIALKSAISATDSVLAALSKSSTRFADKINEDAVNALFA